MGVFLEGAGPDPPEAPKESDHPQAVAGS
jgi:hypothetical protein